LGGHHARRSPQAAKNVFLQNKPNSLGGACEILPNRLAGEAFAGPKGRLDRETNAKIVRSNAKNLTSGSLPKEPSGGVKPGPREALQ
jgi:hypothetical protein